MKVTPHADWASPPARVLLLLALVASIATLPLTHYAGLAGAAVIGALCVALGRPPARRLAVALLSALAMSAAVAAPRALAAEWTAFASYIGRAALAVIAAVGLASSLDAADLGPALRALGLPRALCGVVQTMLRQTQAVQVEGGRILLARRLRGGNNVAPEVLSALLVRTLERAERADLAARLRGYDDEASPAPRLISRDLTVLLSGGSVAIALHWI